MRASSEGENVVITAGFDVLLQEGREEKSLYKQVEILYQLILNALLSENPISELQASNLEFLNGQLREAQKSFDHSTQIEDLKLLEIRSKLHYCDAAVFYQQKKLKAASTHAQESIRVAHKLSPDKLEALMGNLPPLLACIGRESSKQMVKLLDSIVAEWKQNRLGPRLICRCLVRSCIFHITYRSHQFSLRSEFDQAVIKEVFDTLLNAKFAKSFQRFHSKLFVSIMSYIDNSFESNKWGKLTEVLCFVIGYLDTADIRTADKAFLLQFYMRLGNVYCCSDQWALVEVFLLQIDKVVMSEEEVSSCHNLYYAVQSTVFFIRMQLSDHQGDVARKYACAEKVIAMMNEINRDLSVNERERLAEAKGTLNPLLPLETPPSIFIDPIAEAEGIFRQTVAKLLENTTVLKPLNFDMVFLSLLRLNQADDKEARDHQISFALAKIYFYMQAYHLHDRQKTDKSLDALASSIQSLDKAECNDKQLLEYLKAFAALLPDIPLDEGSKFKSIVFSLLQVLTKGHEIPEIPVSGSPLYEALFNISDYLFNITGADMDQCFACLEFDAAEEGASKAKALKILAVNNVYCCFSENVVRKIQDGHVESAAQLLAVIRNTLSNGMSNGGAANPLSDVVRKNLNHDMELMEVNIDCHHQMTQDLAASTVAFKRFGSPALGFVKLVKMFQQETLPDNQLELVFNEYFDFCRWACSEGSGRFVEGTLAHARFVIQNNKIMANSLRDSLLSQYDEIQGLLGNDQDRDVSFERVFARVANANIRYEKRIRVMFRCLKYLMHGTENPYQVLSFYSAIKGNDQLTSQENQLTSVFLKSAQHCVNCLFSDDWPGFVKFGLFYKGLDPVYYEVISLQKWFKKFLYENFIDALGALPFDARVFCNLFDKYFKKIGINLKNLDEIVINVELLKPEKMWVQKLKFIAAVFKEVKTINTKIEKQAELERKKEDIERVKRNAEARVKQEAETAEKAAHVAEVRAKNESEARKSAKKHLKIWFRGFLSGSGLFPGYATGEVILKSGAKVTAEAMLKLLNPELQKACGVSIVFKDNGNSFFWDLTGYFSRCTAGNLAPIEIDGLNLEQLKVAGSKLDKSTDPAEKVNASVSADPKESMAVAFDDKAALDNLNAFSMIRLLGIQWVLQGDFFVLPLEAIKPLLTLADQLGQRQGDEVAALIEEEQLDADIFNALVNSVEKDFHAAITNYVTTKLKSLVEGGAKNKKAAVEQSLSKSIMLNIAHFPFGKILGQSKISYFGQAECDVLVRQYAENFKVDCVKKSAELASKAERVAESARKAQQKRVQMQTDAAKKASKARGAAIPKIVRNGRREPSPKSPSKLSNRAMSYTKVSEVPVSQAKLVKTDDPSGSRRRPQRRGKNSNSTNSAIASDASASFPADPHLTPQSQGFDSTALAIDGVAINAPSVPVDISARYRSASISGDSGYGGSPRVTAISPDKRYALLKSPTKTTQGFFVVPGVSDGSAKKTECSQEQGGSKEAGADLPQVGSRLFSGQYGATPSMAMASVSGLNVVAAPFQPGSK